MSNYQPTSTAGPGDIPPGDSGQSTAFGGFPKGYQPQTHTGYGPESVGLLHDPRSMEISNIADYPVRSHPEDLYGPGDEWGPGNHPDQVQNYLTMLVESGLLKPQDVRGYWDQKAANAYKTVLAYANASGVEGIAALQQLAANPPLGKAAKGPVLPIQQTVNSQDVTDAFQGATRNLTGGTGYTPAEASAFQQDYRHQEDVSYLKQIEAYNARKEAPQGGGQFEGAPSPDVAARQYVLGHNQQDIVNYDMALRTLQFESALKEIS